MTSEALDHPRCPACGYDATGLTRPRCPECGRAFSEEEWANQSILVLAPAWDRRSRIGRIRAFAATVLFATIRPIRFLRMVRRDHDAFGTAWFAFWLFPAASLLSLLLFLAWQGRSDAYIRDGVFFKGVFILATTLSIRCGALLLAGIAAWLPGMIALDLICWRHREVFRRIVRAWLYTLSWWFWAAAIMSGIGNVAIVRLARYIGPKWEQWGLPTIGLRGHASSYNRWCWGRIGGWDPFLLRAMGNPGGLGGEPEMYWPWVCWLAVALCMLQFLALRWSAACQGEDTASGNARFRSLLSLGLFGGWIVTVYLFLFDRHFMLRFHLQFAVEDLSGVYDWFWHL